MQEYVRGVSVGTAKSDADGRVRLRKPRTFHRNEKPIVKTPRGVEPIVFYEMMVSRARKAAHDRSRHENLKA